MLLLNCKADVNATNEYFHGRRHMRWQLQTLAFLIPRAFPVPVKLRCTVLVQGLMLTT
jgi:hypothetical protein